MGKMTLDQGVMKRAVTTPAAPRKGGRVIMPGPGPQKPSFSIGRLESIFKGDDKPSFCIIRTLGGIGDVLMTTPLCRGLKRKWPGCKVTYATDKDYMNGSLHDILKYNPYIDEVIPHQIVQGKKFDASTDISSVCTRYEKKENPPVNRIDLFSHASGIPLFGDKLPIYIVTDEEKTWAKAFLKKYTIKHNNPKQIRWVGIQARSNSDRRNWPINRVKELAIQLAHQDNVRVVVFDHNDQEAWNLSRVVPVINYKIRQVAALIDAMDLIVCHDSGLLHIAGALEKRIVSVFGSTDPRSRINYYVNAIGVEDTSLQCLHCWYASCQYQYACMKNITVDQMMKTVLNHLQTKEARDKQIQVSAPGQNAVVLKRDLGGIGDMMMVTPVLRGLRERFKNKEVHLMIPDQYRPIFYNNPYIDKIIPVNNNIYKFYEFGSDISTVCAKYEYKSLKDKKIVDKSRVEIFCDEAGVNPSRYRPELFLDDEEKDWARKFIEPYKDNFIIGVALRSAELYRDWPISHYRKVFQAMQAKDSNIKFLILDKERIWDFPYENIIDGAGFPFRKFIALVHRCHMVLTPDTSLLHIAGAFNKKTIALFGPIDYKMRCKFYPKATPILDDSLECIPCWRNSRIPCSKNNSLDESVCIQNILPDRVVNAILEKR